MRHYVKLIDGKIIDGPNEISYNESDSPNIHWSDEQMKLNGFVRVDLEHDRELETVDIQNPVITRDTVNYNKIPYSKEKILNDAKYEESLLIERMAREIIQKKYDNFTLTMASIEATKHSQDIKIDCLNIISACELMIDEINLLTTKEAVKSYEIIFPTI